MNPEDKIYLTGHIGLAGSAILRALEKKGFRNIVTRTHRELDLTDQAAAKRFFEEVKPDNVFLEATKLRDNAAAALKQEVYKARKFALATFAGNKPVLEEFKPIARSGRRAAAPTPAPTPAPLQK